MGYERAAWIALVSTLLLILLVEAQDIIPAPVVPAPCPGSQCKTNICKAKGLKCCQCEATAITILGGIQETCACCPNGYSCCPSTTRPLERTCCPAGWTCNPLVKGGCSRLTAPIPSTRRGRSCATPNCASLVDLRSMCSKLCLIAQQETCCGCELDGNGQTTYCNCCPAGYKCCGTAMQSRCCPVLSSCTANGQCLETTSSVSATLNQQSCKGIIAVDPPRLPIAK